MFLRAASQKRRTERSGKHFSHHHVIFFLFNSNFDKYYFVSKTCNFYNLKIALTGYDDRSTCLFYFSSTRVPRSTFRFIIPTSCSPIMLDLRRCYCDATTMIADDRSQNDLARATLSRPTPNDGNSRCVTSATVLRNEPRRERRRLILRIYAVQ